MKRDFLKNLGIEDKEVIDKIMDENMADIGAAKGKATADVEKLQEQVKELEKQIGERDSQLEKLKDIDADKLTAEIERLQNENKTIKEDSEKRLNELSLNIAIKEGLIKAEAKDVDKVMRLLDMSAIKQEKDGKLTGLDEQIEALKGEELTKTWFGKVAAMPKGAEPIDGSGGTPATKKLKDMTYEELDAFMKANPGVDIDTME